MNILVHVEQLQMLPLELVDGGQQHLSLVHFEALRQDSAVSSVPRNHCRQVAHVFPEEQLAFADHLLDVVEARTDDGFYLLFTLL